LLAPSIRAERATYAEDNDWRTRRHILREEAFVTWNLAKSTKKTPADAMNSADDEENDDEEGLVVVILV
jgi:hypothetical protein